mmetsp:Transcript_36846/g.59597  ORF Transcript_36846/g.59597 Transcript_36846/m.59597 type:complete len:225 (-) Transcript_36846:596-1270(-)
MRDQAKTPSHLRRGLLPLGKGHWSTVTSWGGALKMRAKCWEAKRTRKASSAWKLSLSFSNCFPMLSLFTSQLANASSGRSVATPIKSTRKVTYSGDDPPKRLVIVSNTSSTACETTIGPCSGHSTLETNSAHASRTSASSSCNSRTATSQTVTSALSRRGDDDERISLVPINSRDSSIAVMTPERTATICEGSLYWSISLSQTPTIDVSLDNVSSRRSLSEWDT